MLRYILRWSLLLLFGSGLFPGCVFARPLVYVAKSVSGQVVDADSSQPLEGVIVTINWELTGGMHHYPQGQAHVDETVTGSQGKFSFLGWGPQPAPMAAHLYESTPQLLFFKSGYEWNKCVSDLDTDVNMRVPLSSDCDGKTIKLKKFTGSVEEYAKRTGLLDDYLEFAFRHHDCSWQKIPYMLIAMDQEAKDFKTRRIYSGTNTIEEREGHNKSVREKCGSVQEFLRSHRQ